MNVLAIVSVLTIALFGQMANCWDQELRDYILNIHNEMRRRPKGCEVNKLEYDSSLEQQAEGWAKKCAFRHEMKQDRGENLAWNSNDYDGKKLIDIATKSWYDEIKDYSYGQRSCSRSCHYTQLVWGATEKVGCFMHKCANLAYAAPNAHFLVCFYTPMGNWSGEKPYKLGCPSTCAAGQTEDNGLCVGKATGGGSGGGACADSSAKCGGWASRGECNRNPKYMHSKCAKSCNKC